MDHEFPTLDRILRVMITRPQEHSAHERGVLDFRHHMRAGASRSVTLHRPRTPRAVLLSLALVGCSAGTPAPVAPTPLAVPPAVMPQPPVVWTTAAVSAPRVQYRTFTSAVACATVSYHVYTPVPHDGEPTRRLAPLPESGPAWVRRKDSGHRFEAIAEGLQDFGERVEAEQQAADALGLLAGKMARWSTSALNPNAASNRTGGGGGSVNAKVTAICARRG